MNNSKFTTAATEDLIKRLCRGVIAYGQDLELLLSYSGKRVKKYVIRCNEADIPRILGKGGVRFAALRWVMKISGFKADLNLHLDTIVDSIKGKSELFPETKFNPNWPRDEIAKLAADTCEHCLMYRVTVAIVEGHETAVIRVMASPDENEELIVKTQKELNLIFNGIGTTNGCPLIVEIQT